MALFSPDNVPKGGERIAKSRATLANVTDGLSKTIMIGEGLHDVDEQVRVGATRAEPNTGDHKDHWAMGSDDIDSRDGNDLSETVGSSGVPINYQNRVDSRLACEDRYSDDCAFLQLSFSSAHPGGCYVAHGDVSVKFYTDDTDASIWSELGTRASQLPVVSNCPPR